MRITSKHTNFTGTKNIVVEVSNLDEAKDYNFLRTD
jgi:hypothetical protein